MTISDDLSAALKEAMKAKDKPKLDAIRQVQTEVAKKKAEKGEEATDCLLYTSPSPRDAQLSRMPSSA